MIAQCTERKIRRLINLAADAGFLTPWDARELLESFEADAVSAEAVVYVLSEQWVKGRPGWHEENARTFQAECDFARLMNGLAIRLLNRAARANRKTESESTATELSADDDLALVESAERARFSQFD